MLASFFREKNQKSAFFFIFSHFLPLKAQVCEQKEVILYVCFEANHDI
jgi:hypothetical protein